MNKSITVRFNCPTAAVALWCAVLILATVESTVTGHGTYAMWAIVGAAAAATFTVSALLAHTRRVVLDVMSWEHRNVPPPPHEESAVVPLQRDRV